MLVRLLLLRIFSQACTWPENELLGDNVRVFCQQRGKSTRWSREGDPLGSCSPPIRRERAPFLVDRAYVPYVEQYGDLRRFVFPSSTGAA